MGVACEISGLGEFVPKFKGSFGPLDFVVDGEKPQNTVLPDTVREWLGLAHEYGWYNNGEGSLVRLDDWRSSFTMIANIIESEPEGLIA